MGVLGQPEGETFLRKLHVRSFSEIFEPVDVDIIGESGSIGQDDLRLARKLSKKTFTNAIRAIILSQFRHQRQFERSGWDEKLSKISGIKECKEIISIYLINGEEIIGNEEVSLKDGYIYIIEKFRKEKLQKLSYLISEVILGRIDETKSLSSWIMNLLQVPNPETFLKEWGIKNTKVKPYPEAKLPSQNSRIGLIDPKNIKGDFPPNIKPDGRSGGRGGSRGGGGGRPPQNHSTDYGEIREWIIKNEDNFCQSCVLICKDCNKSRNIEYCDCELNKEVHGELDIHHFERFEGRPERDKKGNLGLLCKYHHKILDRVENFKLGFKENKIIIEDNEEFVILTLYPELMGGEDLKLQFTKEHFNYFKHYMQR